MLKVAEEEGIIVVAAAGNNVGIIILIRLSALYELTI
jgi:hypothetical protein